MTSCQDCRCQKRGSRSQWMVTDMDVNGLGGALHLLIRCKGCAKEIRYRSDDGTDVKTKVVASCHVGGIPFAKYRRWGICLGKFYYWKWKTNRASKMCPSIFSCVHATIGHHVGRSVCLSVCLSHFGFFFAFFEHLQVEKTEGLTGTWLMVIGFISYWWTIWISRHYRDSSIVMASVEFRDKEDSGRRFLSCNKRNPK